MEKMNDVLQKRLTPILDHNEKQAKKFIEESSIKETIEIARRILKNNNKHLIVKEALEKLAKYEKYNPSRRDHVIHTIHTYLLGLHIIENLGISDDNIFFVWKITSLFHDIGYEYSDYFLDKSPINKHLEDHGFWSSQITWSILFSQYLERNPDKDIHKTVTIDHHEINFDWSNLTNYILPANNAILLHNKPKAYLKKLVDYREHKYAFLLILCDTIQNWSRPKWGNTNPKSEHTKPNQYKIKCYRNGNKYKIIIEFPNKREAERAKNELDDKCHLKAIIDNNKKLTISWEDCPEKTQSSRIDQ